MRGKLSLETFLGTLGQSMNQPLIVRAKRIADRLSQRGILQVRIYRGWILTYPFPARRGYGTRGQLVGIYTSKTPVSWILDDLRTVLSDSQF